MTAPARDNARVMNYCCAGEYGLVESGSISAVAATAHRSMLLRWHAVRITDGKPEDRAVDGFRYAEADLVVDCDWEYGHLARCWSCAQELRMELTGYER
ncbi:MAG: hypothetical protein ACTHPS_09200 [Streptosporangiaceae bacterium]